MVARRRRRAERSGAPPGQSPNVPPRRTDKTIQESSVGMNGKLRPFPAAPLVPRGRRMVAIVWLFTGIVACLLVAAVLSLGLLSAGRGLVWGPAALGRPAQ